jgi:predicted metal-dependent HD superfamily phosphohydrolase
MFEDFEISCKALGASQGMEAVHAALVTAYQTPSRAYHTLRHIEACLRLLSKHASLAKNHHELVLAIWFHDAVYEGPPGPLSNEEASAQLALTACASMGVASTHAERIAQLIRRTERHEISPEEAREDTDLALFLDIDLSILGQGPYTYATFERDVREEYKWVPSESVYLEGRTQVLTKLLARTPLYHTLDLRARFEMQARTNLRETLAAIADIRSTTHTRTTDTHLYTVNRGRLVQAYPWSRTQVVVATRHGLKVCFDPERGRDTIEGGTVSWLDVVSMTRLRNLPDYDRRMERAADPSGEQRQPFAQTWHRDIQGDAPAVLPGKPLPQP